MVHNSGPRLSPMDHCHHCADLELQFGRLPIIGTCYSKALYAVGKLAYSAMLAYHSRDVLASLCPQRMALVPEKVHLVFLYATQLPV